MASDKIYLYVFVLHETVTAHYIVSVSVAHAICPLSLFFSSSYVRYATSESVHRTSYTYYYANRYTSRKFLSSTVLFAWLMIHAASFNYIN